MLNGEKSKENNDLGCEIVVTEAMIEAGVDFLLLSGALHENFSGDYSDVVKSIIKESLALSCKSSSHHLSIS